MTIDHSNPAADLAVLSVDLQSVAEQAGDENFPVALRLLPKQVREHLGAVYAYARFIDDLGDRYPGDRLAALASAEHELDEAFAHRSAHPIFARIASTAEAIGTGRGPLDRLIEANRLDQRKSRYATFEELVEYCSLSADPVGRLVLGVFGVTDERACRLSDQICTALQIVEHLQDIGEDCRDGRIYFPTEDLERFGVAPAELAATAATPALRRLVAYEASRARTMLEDGLPLVARFGGARRLALAGFVGGGLAQLDEIERQDYDVLAGLAKASKQSVLRRAGAAAIQAGRSRS